MRLHDYLNFNARENSEGEFALDSSRALTNAQAAAEANQLATAFVAAGIEVGDRVAMLSKNSVEYAVFYFGASAAGAVPVPLNYRLAPAEWAYIVNDSGARMMIASDEFAEAVDTVRGELGSVEQYRQIGGDPRDGWESYAGWTGGQSAEPCGRLIRDDADAYQMYTSGTTGHPKGAVLQQRAVTSNVTQVVTSGLAFSPGGRALVVAPMYHAGRRHHLVQRHLRWCQPVHPGGLHPSRSRPRDGRGAHCLRPARPGDDPGVPRDTRT